jgi:uncharacterized membrane protein
VADGQTRFIHTMNELLGNSRIAGISGTAVVIGVAVMYAWLVFIMLRFHRDEDELGPGQVHV